jgi:protein-L-isoaspartate(D-aspartate) O-methyltransferase
MDRDRDLNDVDFISARLRMVDEQLSRRGIVDAAVLAAMRTVPRHEFVGRDKAERAYGDHPLSIDFEQTISQPYMVASMTQELGLSPDSRVLEIGTGCGYQTAVLAEVARYVYTVECIPELLHGANDRLHELGYSNFSSLLGDGCLGWAEHAPYDGILVAAAAVTIPPVLLDQLADPGRMVIPVGPMLSGQELVLVSKEDGEITQRDLYGVRFVPLRTDLEI